MPASRDARRGALLRGLAVLLLATMLVAGGGALARQLRAASLVPGAFVPADPSGESEESYAEADSGGADVQIQGEDAPDLEGGLEVEDPAAVGDEPDAAELSSLMDDYLGRNFPAAGTPGVAVAVVGKGGVLYERTMGDCPDRDSSFVIGSLSKSFTAVAIMQLVEAGRMDLDAPVSAYVSDCGQPDCVTVRSLLNQTSGFGYYDSLADAWPGASAGSFSYSNANYDLLGRAIERVSGMSYASYLRLNVFDPLGMDDASIDPELASSAVPGHRNWFGLSLADGYVHANGDDAWGGPPSGYVRASLSDMESYLRMYLLGGEGVLSSRGVRSLAFSRVADPAGDTYYGMGWTTFNWDDGEVVMSHDGQVENYVARMMVLPARGIAIVVLGDASDYFGGNETFWELADGVCSVAVGGEAQDVNSSLLVEGHASFDLLYLVMVGCSLAALLRTRGWVRRYAAAREQGRARDMVVPALVAHLMLPLGLLWVPASYGVPWRDFSTFVPDATLVLVVTIVLLLAGGAARSACVLRSVEKR